MRIAGEFVALHLSPKGLQALSAVLPPQFSAFGIEENELGIWIWKPGEGIDPQSVKTSVPKELVPAVLLKREYFSYAALEIDLRGSRGVSQIDQELG